MAYASEFINEEEFVLLYDANKPKNPEIPFGNYESFDLDSMTDDMCKTEFRFFKNDIYNLIEVLNLPDEIICYNGLNVNVVEAVCVLLKRFAYPCRYVDLIPRFARPEPQICMISNTTMNLIYDNWQHLLVNLNQPWLSRQHLQEYAEVIHEKGAALENCWGFIDGTVRAISRPRRNQRVMYNGHKKMHAIKFQSIVAPNGLIANLYGPVEGKRHDSAMLAQSQVLTQLQNHSFGPNGNVLCIYGDPAYPIRQQLQCPFRGARLTAIEKEWNKSMSKVRVSVEWIFGDIVNYFKFLDFKKNLKIGLSAVAKMYVTCALFHNARACLHGTITSKFFDINPPAINDYFQ